MRIRTWFTLAVGAAIGGSVVYLLDPVHGPERRRDAWARLRREASERLDSDALATQARIYADRVKGGFQESMSAAIPSGPIDDKTLAHKVESEVVGPADVTSGQIVVEAVDGVVTLRGQVGVDRQITELVSATRRVDGVRGVRNLLHLPSDPAPTRSSNGHGAS
jgi:hypothetical protein